MRSLLRRSLSLSLGLATLPALACIGCSGSGSSSSGTQGTIVAATVTRDLHPTVASGSASALVSGNTDFALGLYHGLSSGSTTDNLFFSPYSVSLALAMTYAGAQGSTASQMATALSFTLPDAQLNPAFDQLDLAIEANPTTAKGANGQPFALKLANSLWGDEKVTFGQPFVNTLAADYGASLRTVDFVNQSTQAEAAINAWVASETNNLIDPLLGPGAVGPSTELVLVNTVYFNAAWASQFQPSETSNGAFTRADGSAVQTPLMSSASVASTYTKGSNYEAVELPYSGGTTSMVIVLPDAGAYADVEKGLSGSFFATVSSALQPQGEIDLTMPKFKIAGAAVSLVTPLEALGMTDAFNPKKANFDGMIPAGGSFISDIIHKAFVDVDESGTEAAAATAVIVGGASVAETPVIVNVNRTFFFFIRDVSTGTVLFVGRENDPTTT